jgi:hypothetical protein
MIDEGLPEKWPEGVQAAARELRLGHVFDIDPFFYLADTIRPVWVASRALAEAEDDEGASHGHSVVDLSPGSPTSPARVILTSQTCDVGEAGDVWEFPWVQVGPVYRVHADDPVLLREYVVRLTANDLQGTGIYVADLRIEMPVEKGVLVATKCQPGFETEEEEIHFAEILGRRRQRPALANEINRYVRGALRNTANSHRNAWKRTRQEIHKVMLAIEEGPRLAPRIIRVVVVSPAPLSPGARDWFERWYERARDAAADSSLVLAPMRFMDNGNFDVRAYDGLLELDLTF